MRRSARVAAAAGATAPPANSTAVQTKYRTKKAPAAKKSAATKRAAPGRGANAIPSAKRKKKGLKGHLDTHAPLGVVDPASNIEGDIFLSPIDDEPLDVMLVLVDPSKNMDKYIVLQLIELDEATSERQFVVYTRWGRTGTAGQGLEQAFQDADDALRCFEEKFTEKSGLDWANREDAPVADKYCFIRQNFAAKKGGFADGWEYWVDDGVDGKQSGWYPYDQAGAICTEQLYQESLLNQQHTTRMVSSGAWIYEVNLTSMTQTNATHPNRTIRHIRRVTPGAVMSSVAPIAAQQGAAAHTAAQVPVAVVAGVGAGVRKPTVVKTAVKPQNVIAKPPPAAVMKPASRPVDPDVAVRGLMPTDYDVVKADGDGDVWYDSVLNQCDITGSTNSNKYYRIQVLKHKITQEFYTWTRWGRVGEPTCVSSSAILGPFGSIEECRPSFAKKFKDKTGNAWGLGAFKSKKGKYEPVEIDLNTSAADISDAAPAADVEYMECTLDAKTKELVEQMFSKDMQNAALQAWSLDVKKMPLGCPSEQQIQHGVVVLNRIKRKLAGPQHSDTFEELSSAFYTAIPHSFGRLRPPVINTDEMLQSRFDMCDVLTDLLTTKETMTKIEKAQPKKTVVPNPIDQQYLSLNAVLSVLDRSSAEFAVIEKYFNETKQDSSAQLLDVWIVKREGEAERFQTHAAIDNHRLLFHGTNLCVAAPIVTSGLRIMPHSGGRVGRGLYLASQQAKSAQYTSAHGAKFAVMFLAQAALGKSHTITADGPHASGLVAAPSGYQSVHAVGSLSPTQWATVTIDNKPVSAPCAAARPTGVPSEFLHDEFLVYQESQVRLRYLLTVKL